MTWNTVHRLRRPRWCWWWCWCWWCWWYLPWHLGNRQILHRAHWSGVRIKPQLFSFYPPCQNLRVLEEDCPPVSLPRCAQDLRRSSSRILLRSSRVNSFLRAFASGVSGVTSSVFSTGLYPARSRMSFAAATLLADLILGFLMTSPRVLMAGSTRSLNRSLAFHH